MKTSGKISLIALVWLAVAAQLFINRGIQRRGDAVEAFSSSEVIPVEACISTYGDFGEMALTGETKDIMLRNLAKKLGITDGYEITASGGNSYQESTLTKNGKYGKTVIQIVSMDVNGEEGVPVVQQTVLSDITIYEDLAYAMECKEQIEEIYREIGMEPNVNICLKGKVAGELSDSRCRELTEDILEKLNASVVQEIDNENYYCLYGYTDRFDRVIYQNGKKINVNLVITYNEEEDMSYLRLAVPYISQSF